MSDIGEQIRARVSAIEELLPAKEAQLEALSIEVKVLRDEHQELGRLIGQLDGIRRTPPAVSDDDQIVEAVRALAGDSPSTSKEVAERLGVTPRNVGRKLRKLVDEGKLTGDAKAGYAVAA